ncbi:MAG: hypothetical protein PHP04_08255 [Bacteroidales bacterium]|nr:hypothetical protein [Bacteroidales bacterium]HNW74840.1 hypothetical protein [Bacteroidales bacterium]HPS51518.1 hypothetical protein [Bacteroidales bacterium]
MKTVKQFLLILLILLPSLLQAMDKEIPFTLDDRDRIIRTEQKVESLRTELNTKIDTKVDALDKKIDTKFDGLRAEMNARFDQLFNFLWAIIGIFTTMMISVFGFAFWDRKLSLAPVKKDQTRIIESLRQLSETQPKLREILKNAGLL